MNYRVFIVIDVFDFHFILEKDPAPAFFNPKTQQLLKSITRLQLEKIYKKRTVKNNHPEYK